MIYVTTGTHPIPFDRLIAAMDAYADSTTEPVIIQAGASRLPIQHAQPLTFISWDEARQHIKAARLVVCQAGDGTLMDVIAANVRTIVWPRLAGYGEVANDHQLEIAHRLAQQGRVTLVQTTEELSIALGRADLPHPQRSGSESTDDGGLIRVIKGSLDQLRQTTPMRRS